MSFRSVGFCTGSLFYLKNVVCRFLALVRRACGLSDEWAMLTRQANPHEATVFVTQNNDHV